MSDIKNIFLEEFKYQDLSLFSKSDLERLGIYEYENENKNVNKNKKINKSIKNKDIDLIFKKYGKIIPQEPKKNINKKNGMQIGMFKNETIEDNIKKNVNRHKLYYHTHKEELKYKRLIKEGRYDVIELFSNLLIN